MNSLLNISAKKKLSSVLIFITDTRTSDVPHIPLYKTATGQSTFTSGATNIWNSLDRVANEIKSLKTFKAIVKKLLHNLN